jgi:hypothetical protein
VLLNAIGAIEVEVEVVLDVASISELVTVPLVVDTVVFSSMLFWERVLVNVVVLLTIHVPLHVDVIDVTLVEIDWFIWLVDVVDLTTEDVVVELVFEGSVDLVDVGELVELDRSNKVVKLTVVWVVAVRVRVVLDRLVWIVDVKVVFEELVFSEEPFLELVKVKVVLVLVAVVVLVRAQVVVKVGASDELLELDRLDKVE